MRRNKQRGHTVILQSSVPGATSLLHPKSMPLSHPPVYCPSPPPAGQPAADRSVAAEPPGFAADIYAPVSGSYEAAGPTAGSRRAASEGAGAALAAVASAAAVAASSRVSGLSLSIRKLDGCGNTEMDSALTLP